MTTAIVLGYGSIGKRHADNLVALGFDGFVFDPVQSSNLRSLRNPYGIILGLGDWMAVCAGAIVVVASPTDYHADQAEVAILNGARAVYVEKPPAKNAKRWERVVGQAKAHGVKLAVGFNWRFHPATEALRATGPIRDGTLIGLDDFWRWPTEQRAHLRKDGVLWCSASHSVDLMLHLYGPAKCNKSLQLHDSSTLLLEGDGWQVTIINSWASRRQISQFFVRMVDGSLADVDFLDDEWQEAMNADMHRDCVAQFVEWADGGEPGHLCTGEQALATLEILGAAER